ncbi:MAG: vWA domain-containing protein [Paludibacteraceae bacterium]|nr:vWA domain-containing protein [Paludibacteraceae bacterium]
MKDYMINKLLLFILFSLTIYTVGAQPYLNEKRVYLLDVTASMEGRGIVETPNIFDNVKNQLSNSLSNITYPQTEIVIVPFTESIFNPIRGNITQIDSLVNEISKIGIEKGDTNIADAWEYGISELDSTKVNYLFLLTDGLHNHGVEKEVLYKRLQEWQYIAKDKYMFAFYVMLTPNAKEMEIIEIIESTNKLWAIESMNVNVSFINSTLNLKSNINNDKKVRIDFSSQNNEVFNSGLQLNIRLEENPFYELCNLNSNIINKYVEFEIKELLPRIQIPIETQQKLYLEYDKEKNPLVFFTPEIINFSIVNKGVRIMTINEK